MRNPFSLEGKTILVTGASSGIGQKTAIESSKLGATLIVTGRNPERLQETFGQLEGTKTEHCQILADLTKEDEVKDLVSKVSNLDGILLSAGLGLTTPFSFASREKYNKIFEVNFFSSIELLRLLYKKKKINNNGSVVFISSIGGNSCFTNGGAIYGASKAAISSTVKYCALEFAGKKIRVNAVAPGMVNTSLIHRGTISEEQLQKDSEKYPLKRYGNPEDVSFGVIYLFSDVSSWVTGTTIVIDGGASLV